ncbi:MAG: hypothetical protein ACR2P4_01895 [Gammaproteobacteria bacterium]
MSPMPKAAAKADWEIAIEKLAAMTAADKAEAKAEAKARAAEAEVRAAKSESAMEKLSKHFDTELTEEGEMLECDVAAAIVEDMSLGGVKFDEVITNAFVHGKHGNGEFDWIGINGKITMVGETKRTLNLGDVRRFVFDRMELFKHSRYSNLAKGKEVRGVLIYQKARKGAVEEALKLKMMVFRAEDDKTLRPVKTPADIPKRTQTKTHKRPRKSAA